MNSPEAMWRSLRSNRRSRYSYAVETFSPRKKGRKTRVVIGVAMKNEAITQT